MVAVPEAPTLTLAIQPRSERRLEAVRSRKVSGLGAGTTGLLSSPAGYSSGGTDWSRFGNDFASSFQIASQGFFGAPMPSVLPTFGSTKALTVPSVQLKSTVDPSMLRMDVKSVYSVVQPLAASGQLDVRAAPLPQLPPPVSKFQGRRGVQQQKKGLSLGTVLVGAAALAGAVAFARRRRGGPPPMRFRRPRQPLFGAPEAPEPQE